MKNNFILSVDFDNIVVNNIDYPKKMELIPNAKKIINKWYDRVHIVMSTCRTGIDLKYAVDFMKKHEINYDEINDNVKYKVAAWGVNCRKIYADLYIDDKNIECLRVDWLNYDDIIFGKVANMKPEKTIIMFDGLEATGKSTMLKKLSDEHGYQYVHFPSKKVFETYGHMMNSDDIRMTKAFVDILIDDEYKVLSSQKEGIILVDRMFLSAMVYQGRSLELLEYISEKYYKMYTCLRINIDDSLTVAFPTKIPNAKRLDKHDNLKCFDTDKDGIRTKRLNRLLESDHIKPLHGKLVVVDYDRINPDDIQEEINKVYNDTVKYINGVKSNVPSFHGS